MGYVQIHQMLRKHRGPAKEYACKHCGLPAVHWAYDHADPCRIFDGQGRVYSLDMAHYLPLCARCHSFLDTSFGEIWKFAKLLDTPCVRCGARPGEFCRTTAGLEYKTIRFQHVWRHRDAPVDTRHDWIIKAWPRHPVFDKAEQRIRSWPT